MPVPEIYNTKVLNQIGNQIGSVLQFSTFAKNKTIWQTNIKRKHYNLIILTADKNVREWKVGQFDNLTIWQKNLNV